MALILALDISTKTGWASFKDEKLEDFGLIEVKIENYNPKNPELSSSYPKNFVDAANSMGIKIIEKINVLKPDFIVLENTVKGRNRHSQRILEFIHKKILDFIYETGQNFCYVDPSKWRQKLDMRLSKEDKKNNQLVSKGFKRGRIGKKHLSVRWVNSFFDQKFKIKDNNITDAICLGASYVIC